MNVLHDIFTNFPLIISLAAWLAAQVIKFLIVLILYPNKLTRKTIMSSGGMPSSHSAIICALTTSIALTEGLASPLFAICTIVSFIVMYDAAGVRRSAGEQAQMLNEIIAQLSEQNQLQNEQMVREIFGHTPLQVFVGAGIGIILPIIVYFGFLA